MLKTSVSWRVKHCINAQAGMLIVIGSSWISQAFQLLLLPAGKNKLGHLYDEF